MDDVTQTNQKVYRPQPGPQYAMLASQADILIFGGSAGGGKTYGLLLETLWNHDVPGFTCAIFRKNSTQIRSPGGLWANSQDLFREFGGVPKESTLEWEFPKGAVIKFGHIDHEKDKYAWQGSQICLLCFDELTHFSRDQFFYMLSRNRSTCGVRPYVRATTNPDADSWVRDLIDWWINPATGYAIPERSGIIRWFIVINDSIIWGESKADLQEKYPESLPKSFTFISASVFDNQKLLEADPGYLANLHALSKVERERLLNGNWNIKPASGLFFRRSYFEIVESLPAKTKKVRYWDRAATKKTETNDPDFTVGLKLEKDDDGILYISDLVRIQESPLGVQSAIKNTATRDGIQTRIGIEQDPGQAGVSEIDYLLRMLSGYNAKSYKVSKDKVTRASPVSSQAEAGNIKILAAKWNDELFKELENFPDGNHDDIVDALSGAFEMLLDNKFNIQALCR